MIGNYGKKKIIHCNLLGAYMANAFNPGAVVVIHTPRSCSHILAGTLPLFQDRYRVHQKALPYNTHNLYVTGLSSKDAIFGGEQKLKDCLLAVARLRKPEYIMVAAGCVAGVIGDDVVSICKTVENITGIPIFPLPGSGFMNNQAVDPIIESTKYLLNRFVDFTAEEEKKPWAAVLGNNAILTAMADLEELTRLYKYFGFEKVLFPPAGMSVAELKSLKLVSLLAAGGMVIRNHKSITGYTGYLANKMHIPCISLDIPCTPGETYAYLESIGKTLHKPDVAAAAVHIEKEQVGKRLAGYARILKNRKIILAFSMPLRFMRPHNLIAMLQACKLVLQGFLLLPELGEIETEKYKLALHDYGLPFYTESGYLAAKPADTFVITVAPKEYFKKQFCVSIRRIGTGGTVNLWHRLAEFVTDDRSIAYEE